MSSLHLAWLRRISMFQCSTGGSGLDEGGAGGNTEATEATEGLELRADIDRPRTSW